MGKGAEAEGALFIKVTPKWSYPGLGRILVIPAENFHMKSPLGAWGNVAWSPRQDTLPLHSILITNLATVCQVLISHHISVSNLIENH